MSDKCANPNYNMEDGDFCFGGKPRGIAFCDTDLAVDITSLVTESWWTDQVVSATNRVSTIVNSNYSETTPGEVQKHTPEFGVSVRTSKTSAIITLKWKGNLCLRRSMDRFNGKTTYIMLLMDGNGVIGYRSGALQLKFMKANVLTMNEEIDGVDYNVVELSFALDYEVLKKQVQLQEDFIVDDIPTLTGVYFENASAVVALSTWYAYDCNDNLLEGLDDTLFSMTNDTEGGAEAGAWGEVAGLYTFTYTVPVDLGDFMTVGHDGPDATNLFIEGKESTAETTA